MRLKRNRLKTYSHRMAVPRKDNEGGSYIEYGPPSSFSAEVWPAGGKLQAEMYGQRIHNILNCRIDGDYEILTDCNGRVCYRVDGVTIREGDGICLYVPDYKIISIRPYRYLTLEVERL